MDNKHYFVTFILAGCLLLSLIFIRNAGAADIISKEEQMIAAVQDHLAEIEKKIDELLEGQKRLSEEHTQLRYWIHRNR